MLETDISLQKKRRKIELVGDYSSRTEKGG